MVWLSYSSWYMHPALHAGPGRTASADRRAGIAMARAVCAFARGPKVPDSDLGSTQPTPSAEHCPEDVRRIPCDRDCERQQEEQRQDGDRLDIPARVLCTVLTAR